MLWWDQIYNAVVHCRRRPSPSELPSHIHPIELRRCWATYDASSVEERLRISQDLVRLLKAAPDGVRLAVMDDLPARLEVPTPDVVIGDTLLSWAEVREMAAGGIAFGAHTLTHPSLDQVDSHKLRREVEGSKPVFRTLKTE